MSSARKHTHKRGRRGGRVTHTKRGEVQCFICARWRHPFTEEGAFIRMPSGEVVAFVCLGECHAIFVDFADEFGMGVTELERFGKVTELEVAVEEYEANG